MPKPGEEGEEVTQPTQPPAQHVVALSCRHADSFSGVSNWAEWIYHFDAAAQFGKWMDNEKTQLWLPMRLTRNKTFKMFSVPG